MSLASRVTWILPVKNGAPYLGAALESLRQQTAGRAPVLLWDNGSTDGSVELARSYLPSRLPGRVIADRPLPLGQSLAALVELSPSAYCARMDADDLAEPGRLAAQLEVMGGSRPPDVLGSCATRIGPDGRPLPGQHGRAADNSAVIGGFLDGCPLTHPTVLLRRDAVLAAGNYRHDPRHAGGWAEDLDLWLRLAARRATFAVMPDRLLRYRIHPDSVTAAWDADRRLERCRLAVALRNNRAFHGLDAADCVALTAARGRVHLAVLWRLFLRLRHHDGLSPRARLRRHPELFDWAWAKLDRHDAVSALGLALLADRPAHARLVLGRLLSDHRPAPEHADKVLPAAPTY